MLLEIGLEALRPDGECAICMLLADTMEGLQGWASQMTRQPSEAALAIFRALAFGPSIVLPVLDSVAQISSCCLCLRGVACCLARMVCMLPPPSRGCTLTPACNGSQAASASQWACCLMSPCMRAAVQVMDVYQPGAIVVCGGADSLSGDRLGCFNLSLDVRYHGLPSCTQKLAPHLLFLTLIMAYGLASARLGRWGLWKRLKGLPDASEASSLAQLCVPEGGQLCTPVQGGLQLSLVSRP